MFGFPILEEEIIADEDKRTHLCGLQHIGIRTNDEKQICCDGNGLGCKEFKSFDRGNAAWLQRKIESGVGECLADIGTTKILRLP